MEAITSHDQIPAALNHLIIEFDSLNRALAERSVDQPNTDRWFSIEELSEYLPGSPAITTLYGKVQRREIPFSRIGKRLVFRQSEIDAWLQSGHVKTSAELDVIAETYVGAVKSRSGGRNAR